MAKIDFGKIEVFTDLTKERKVSVDMHKTLANALYQQGSGIACHALALKIWNGVGEIELDDDECKIVMRLVEGGCSPSVIDAFHEIIHNS